MAGMSDPVFETERLLIRPAVAKDVELLYDLWTDGRVMAWVGFPRGLRTTREEIHEKIASQGGSEFDRLLLAELIATGETIGECKMKRPDEDGVSGTDVKLLPDFWGHRYGVEIKAGLLAYLFAHTECSCVEATPNVNNVASVKMQEAVGGIRVGEAVYEFPEAMRDFTTSVHHYVYRVYRSHWERGEGASVE
jgi:RimJ/RimL family protein N-acetyltransferase